MTAVRARGANQSNVQPKVKDDAQALHERHANDEGKTNRGIETFMPVPRLQFENPEHEGQHDWQ